MQTVNYIQEYRDTQKDLERYMKIETHAELEQLVKELLIDNKRLKEDNTYYRNIETQLTKNEINESYLNVYDQEDSPMAFHDYIIRGNCYFMTITFDPKRFDNFHLVSSDEQKKYILYQLHKYRHHMSFIYGCFEKHKNGVIHSHIIMNPVDEDYFRQNCLKKLKSAFTRNAYSKITIDYQLVKSVDKTIEYIDNGGKEKYGFFRHYNDNENL